MVSRCSVNGKRKKGMPVLRGPVAQGSSVPGVTCGGQNIVKEIRRLARSGATRFLALYLGFFFGRVYSPNSRLIGEELVENRSISRWESPILWRVFNFWLKSLWNWASSRFEIDLFSTSSSPTANKVARETGVLAVHKWARHPGGIRKNGWSSRVGQPQTGGQHSVLRVKSI